MSEHKLIVGWAVPIDTPVLLARVEAYSLAKVAFNTFRLAFTQPNAGLKSVPREVLQMILCELRVSYFQDLYRRRWLPLYACSQKTCKAYQHLPSTILAEEWRVFQSRLSKTEKKRKSLDYDCAAFEYHLVANAKLNRICKRNGQTFAECVQRCDIDLEEHIEVRDQGQKPFIF